MSKEPKPNTKTEDGNPSGSSDVKPWMRRAPLEIEATAANLRYIWKKDKEIREANLQDDLDHISDETLALVFDDYVDELETAGVSCELMKQRLLQPIQGIDD